MAANPPMQDDTEPTGEDRDDVPFPVDQDDGPNSSVDQVDGLYSPDRNSLDGKRNFIHNLMDAALLMANVSQLKAVLSLPSTDKYYNILLLLIIMSIFLQVIFTICMIFIWSIERKIEEYNDEEKHQKQKKQKKIADYLDKLGNILVLIIIVSNTFITGFGVQSHDSESQPDIIPTQTPT